MSVSYSRENPEETELVNYHATIQLYDDVCKSDMKIFIFVGSAAEYGNEYSPHINEEYDANLISPYGLQKHRVTQRLFEKGDGISL